MMVGSRVAGAGRDAARAPQRLPKARGARVPLPQWGLAVGRTINSLTSTSSGWPIV